MSALNFLPSGHRHAVINSNIAAAEMPSSKPFELEDLRGSLSVLADSKCTLPWVFGFLGKNGIGIPTGNEDSILSPLCTNTFLLWMNSHRLFNSAEIPQHPLNDPANAGFRQVLESEREQLATLDWIPEWKLAEMREMHLSWLKQAESSAFEDLPMRESNFIRGMSSHSEELGITPEEIEARIKGTRYQMVDYLSGALDMRDGQYLADEERVVGVLGSGLEGEVSLIHEMIHRISGRALVHADGNIRHFKLGLAFYAVNNAGQSVGSFRFAWLNEALNQKILHYVTDYDPSAYKEQRQLLGVLLNQGKEIISPRLFYRAFFEDFDNSSGGHALPAWGRLSKAIAKSFSPGFLNRLNRVVLHEGVEAALAKWEAVI